MGNKHQWPQRVGITENDAERIGIMSLSLSRNHCLPTALNSRSALPPLETELGGGWRDLWDQRGRSQICCKHLKIQIALLQCGVLLPQSHQSSEGCFLICEPPWWALAASWQSGCTCHQHMPPLPLSSLHTSSEYPYVLHRVSLLAI